MQKARSAGRFFRMSIMRTMTLLLVLVLSLAVGVQGQAPSHSDKTGEESKKPKPAVLVVKSVPYISSSMLFTRDVVEGCIDRIKEASSIPVTAGPEMNRKEASEHAKNLTETYVVWVELQPDVGDTEKAGVTPQDSKNWIVNYIIFAPGTGKVKTQGHTYQRPALASLGSIGPRGPWPTTGSHSVGSYPLYRAGQDVGDRVLSALNLARSTRY